MAAVRLNDKLAWFAPLSQESARVQVLTLPAAGPVTPVALEPGYYLARVKVAQTDKTVTCKATADTTAVAGADLSLPAAGAAAKSIVSLSADGGSYPLVIEADRPYLAILCDGVAGELILTRFF